jgi:hypothetical protein
LKNENYELLKVKLKMSQIYNKNTQYIRLVNDNIVNSGCFVCFNDDEKNYGICRHCLLGVCKHGKCVNVFPHIDNTDYLICSDCRSTIEKKLKPILYTEKDECEEKIEKQKSLEILKKAEKEKSEYENVLHHIRILQIF